ncbi:MAG: cobalt-precorrin-6A reductase [Rhizobiaceae bacterium]
MITSKRHKILLLGGTTEAREIAEVLASCAESEALMSLAGRTSFPAAFPTPVRIGGFGGAEGLASFLRENAFDLLINATHPYADQMWRNAIEAAKLADVPLVAFHRPAWTPVAGDKWTEVDGVAGAIAMLGRRKARNVFLPLGHKELVKFEAVPRHRYLIRAIESFDPPLNLPKASYLKARPPFDKASERELLKSQQIDVMIVKNSGGSASYPKIVAARELGIEVIVIDRPFVPDIDHARSVAEVMRATVHALGLRAKRVA